jgi:uncharacterized protein (DUF1330 family)
MSAYVITFIKVSNPEKYKGYMALSPAAITAAGGEFIVRGGAHEVLEGNFNPARVVIVKFASTAAAKAFHDSALYRQARDARAGATEYFNMIVVEGV